MELITKINVEHDGLPDSVKDYLTELVQNDVEKYIQDIAECESPIEQLLGLALSKQFNRLVMVSEACFIEPQHKVKIDEKYYRADFYINASTFSRQVDYIIECDGHNYHERTKEQAQRDRARDRAFLKSGYKTLRYTGAEIYKDPMNCANEIMRLVIKDLLSGD